jgi:hypothetical protein
MYCCFREATWRLEEVDVEASERVKNNTWNLMPTIIFSSEKCEKESFFVNSM